MGLNQILIPGFLLILSCFAYSTTNITLFYTSNINGHLASCECPEELQGGIERLATLLKTERSQHTPSLLLDSGDFFPVKRDKELAGQVLKALFLLNYDAINLGDQELMAMMTLQSALPLTLGGADLPPGIYCDGAQCVMLDTIKDNYQHVPVLSNIRQPKRSVNKTLVKHLDGLRVGILGLTSSEQLSGSLAGKELNHYKTSSGWNDFLKENIPSLTRESDLIILLSQLNEADNIRIAKTYPQINIIIAGHNQVLREEPKRIRDTIIIQAGMNAEYLGRLRISRDPQGNYDFQNTLLPITREYSPAPEVQQLIQQYYNNLKTSTAEPDGLSRNVVYLFSAGPCGYCERLQRKVLPALFKQTGKTYLVKHLDLSDKKQLLAYLDLAGKRTRLPSLYFNGQLLTGDADIDRRLTEVLQ